MDPGKKKRKKRGGAALPVDPWRGERAHERGVFPPGAPAGKKKESLPGSSPRSPFSTREQGRGEKKKKKT